MSDDVNNFVDPLPGSVPADGQLEPVAALEQKPLLMQNIFGNLLGGAGLVLGRLGRLAVLEAGQVDLETVVAVVLDQEEVNLM